MRRPASIRKLLWPAGILALLATPAWGAFTHNFPGETFGLEFKEVPGATKYFSCGYGGAGAGSSPGDPNNACTELKIWSIEDGFGAGVDIKPHPGFCDRPGGVAQCGSGATDSTPYLQEVVNYGGRDYWHQIIGRAEDGWVQEVYYKNEGAGSSPGGIQSPSGGKGGGTFKGNNASRPLHPDASISGNGTGKPTSIAIRMYMNDGGVELDFMKSEFDKKPMITQTETMPGEMKTEFKIDMRNIDYSTSNVKPQQFILRQYNMALADPANQVPRWAFDQNPDTALYTTEPVSGLGAYYFDPTISPPPPPPGQTAKPSGKKVNATGGMYSWNGNFSTPGANYTYADGSWDVFAAGWLHWWNGSSTWQQGDPYPCSPAIDPDYCEQ